MIGVLGSLDPASDRAPFRQIADQLRAFTLYLAPGARLPSEAELMSYYGVARMTARSAVQELIREGLVEARQGAGVFRVAGRDDADAELRHRDDLARDVAREWAIHGGYAWQRSASPTLFDALDRLAAAYGEKPDGKGD